MSRTISKISDFLIRFIYIVFLLLMTLGILSRMSDFSHHSYIICFILAALLTASGILLKKRYTDSLKSKISEKWLYGMLTGVCLAVRLAAVFLLQIQPEGDYLTFYSTAAALAQGEYIPLFQYVSLFPHILGYSAFLSLFFRIFGSGQLIAPIVNVLLSTGSGMLIYTICRRCFGREAAVWAFVLWIICPSVTLYNTLVLSEPFYTNVSLLYILLLSRIDSALGEKKAVWAFPVYGVFGGCLLRIINASRPIAAVLIIATIIVLLLCRARTITRRSAAAMTAYVVILFAAYSISGNAWDAYAEKVLQAQPSTFPGYSLAVGFDEASGGSYSEEDMNRLLDYYYTSGNAQEAQQNMLQDTLDHIRGDHISFGKLFFTKLGTFLGNDEGAAYYNSAGLSAAAYSVLCIACNVFYYAVLLICLIRTGGWLRRPVSSLVMILPLYCVGLTMAQMLVEVSGRYHYSMLPMLIMIAVSTAGKGNGKIEV